jgi:protein TonB
MSAKAIRADAPWYGAMELKRSYQRNMTLGLLVASSLHVSVLGGVAAYKALTELDPVSLPIPTVPRVVEVILEPPPSFRARPELARANLTVAPPTIGIPFPAPDEEVVEEVRIPTQQELAELAVVDASDYGQSAPGSGDSIVVVDASEYFPEPGQFVAFQEEPKCIHSVPAVYPQIAQLTGREGSVTVYALVGKDGTVIKTAIALSSGSNVGFDEAAIEAVSQYRFRPALQNGQPVAVWVSQRIEFKLD